MDVQIHCGSGKLHESRKERRRVCGCEKDHTDFPLYMEEFKAETKVRACPKKRSV